MALLTYPSRGGVTFRFLKIGVVTFLVFLKTSHRQSWLETHSHTIAAQWWGGGGLVDGMAAPGPNTVEPDHVPVVWHLLHEVRRLPEQRGGEHDVILEHHVPRPWLP
eukprot:EG_transcript_50152